MLGIKLVKLIAKAHLTEGGLRHPDGSASLVQQHFVLETVMTNAIAQDKIVIADHVDAEDVARWSNVPIDNGRCIKRF